MPPDSLLSLLHKTIPAQLPLLISGKPGVGKTAIAQAVAEELGYRLIVSHPVIADPTDFKGLPWVCDGNADFLPIGEVRQLLEVTDPTIWLIDDLGQAPLAVQAALMQLIHKGSRQLGGKRLADCVAIVACTNRRQDKAGVHGFLEPVKSRFLTLVELEPDVQQWSTWAFENDLHPMVPAFLRWRPDLLSKFDPNLGLEQSPSPRGWEHVSRILGLGLDDDLLLLETITGAVGEGAATEPMAFLKTWRALPDLERVLADHGGASVPEEPSARYAVCAALAHRADEDTIEPILEYGSRLPEEFQVVLVHFAKVRNPVITNTAAYVKWAVDHQEVLS
jgi:DNA polymerase III delta prime subunit